MQAKSFRGPGRFHRRALPFFLERVPGGFPSPAEGYIEDALDLNELCVAHPAATYYARVTGDSVKDAGIWDGDLVVVDRAIEPRHGHIVVAAVDGEMTIKRLITTPTRQLAPENPRFEPIPLGPESDVQLAGVVTWIVRKVGP